MLYPVKPTQKFSLFRVKEALKQALVPGFYDTVIGPSSERDRTRENWVLRSAWAAINRAKDARKRDRNRQRKARRKQGRR